MTDSFTETIRQHPSVLRVALALKKAGVSAPIIVMPDATHTAQAAADALKCVVAEIAKSIIFRAENGRAVLVITSGKNRVDDQKVASLINQKIGKADADFVRQQTGFVIGGVAPIAHLNPSIVLMDADLMQHANVYPAAGHPNTMFQIAPATLVEIAVAQVAEIALKK
jgi:prolyl-tRNA editing enzyme YbaK/EbsC (Cys-tRNA(Pro) deacylase)